MRDNSYSGPVNVEGMVEFLYTLNGEVEVSQSKEGSFLSDDVDSGTAAEYLEEIVGEEANGSAEPWEDYDGNSIIDPKSLEPWGTGDSYGSRTGSIQLQREEFTDDGVSYRFDLVAEDGEGEQWDISMTGIEPDYEGTSSDVLGHARMSKALRELES